MCVLAGPIINLCHRMTYPWAHHKSDVHQVFLLQGSHLKSTSNTHKIHSLFLLVIQKKLSCFGISGFELSLESCSPLTVLHVACYVENKCTLFLMFIPFFLSLPHFSNVHIINTACPTDAVSLKCTGGLFYSPALRIQHCALVGLWQNSARVQTPHLGRA